MKCQVWMVLKNMMVEHWEIHLFHNMELRFLLADKIGSSFFRKFSR